METTREVSSRAADWDVRETLTRVFGFDDLYPLKH